MYAIRSYYVGLLGGYLVPVLVDTGHQSQAGLLGYVGLISLAALALQCRVKRAWLWWGTLLAHFAWYLLSWRVITSYSIHYTKLYDMMRSASAAGKSRATERWYSLSATAMSYNFV